MTSPPRSTRNRVVPIVSYAIGACGVVGAGIALNGRAHGSADYGAILFPFIAALQLVPILGFAIGRTQRINARGADYRAGGFAWGLWAVISALLLWTATWAL